jgi:hypothetical protein
VLGKHKLSIHAMHFSRAHTPCEIPCVKQCDILRGVVPYDRADFSRPCRLCS